MNQDFEVVLDKAISCLERGEAVEDCLVRYPPEYAGRLEPLLRMSAFSMRVLAHVEPSSEAALAAGKQRLLAAAAQRKPTRRPKGLLSLFPLPMRGLVTAALVVLLLVVVAGEVAVASASSLPGDSLYPVKLATEQVRLLLTFDTQARDHLRAEFAQERRAEVMAVLEASRRVPVKFEGTLEGFEDAAWIIGGLEVTLDANTLIEGNPVVGATVAIEGLALGDGSLSAVRLTVKGAGQIPGPTIAPSPTVTPQPTVAPRLTKEPTRPSKPTVIPRPTITPTMTPSPRETHTPYPTGRHEPEPTDTPVPTATPVPLTGTPMPTVTPVPSPHTPRPTTEPGGGGHDDRDHGSSGPGGGDQGGSDLRGGDQDGGGHDDGL
jgi:hypothetical protein